MPNRIAAEFFRYRITSELEMNPKQPRDFPPVHEPPNLDRDFRTPWSRNPRDGETALEPKPWPSTSTRTGTGTRTVTAARYEPLEFYGARAQETQGARTETDDACELYISLKELELEQLIGPEDTRQQRKVTQKL